MRELLKHYWGFFVRQACSIEQQVAPTELFGLGMICYRQFVPPGLNHW